MLAEKCRGGLECGAMDWAVALAHMAQGAVAALVLIVGVAGGVDLARSWRRRHGMGAGRTDG